MKLIRDKKKYALNRNKTPGFQLSEKLRKRDLDGMSGSNLNRSPKILILEDSVSERHSRKSSNECNYKIHEANNGLEALQILEKGQACLVICDLQNSDVGLDLVARIIEKKKLKSLLAIDDSRTSTLSDSCDSNSHQTKNKQFKSFDPKELILHRRNGASSVKGYLQECQNPEDAEGSQLGFYDKFVKSISDEIEKRINDPDLNVTSLAEFACVSNATLSRILKKNTGFSPWQYIREIRLVKAMNFLEKRKFQTIQQVVFAVGMEDASHFSQIFTRRFGKKPSEVLAGV